jgi:glycosyltransferase involved in cell wall biosynthesis
MHVVLIAAARYPLREPFAGGLEALTWMLARGLTERGITVTVFAGPGSDPILDAQILPVMEVQLSDAARTDVSMPPEAWLREHYAYLQLMLSLGGRSDIDVVHNNSLHHLPIAMAGVLPAPLLTTLHTPPTPWLEPAIGLMDHRRAAFAAVSRHTAQAWSHVTEATVIPNGVDTCAWLPGPGGEDLVWFGRLVPEKAPHLAIEIARRAGRHLRLAGPLSDPAYVAAEVGPHLREGAATYVGHLGQRDLADLVGHSAATLVTPDWDEPYGLVAAESLSCGTPVLAFARGGLPEIVSEETGALVDAGDLQAAADRLERVTRLSRQAARAHAVEHCSVDTMLDRYVARYEELAAGGSVDGLDGAA